MEPGRAWRGGAAWPSFKERGRAAEFVDYGDALPFPANLRLEILAFTRGR